MHSFTNIDNSEKSVPGTINWGAIFASLVFMYALSWLFFTLSSAIGLSIVEIPNPHDTNIKSEPLTLSIALYAWLIGTIVLTYFLGGWLAGRLSGNTDQTVLSLHGLVVWAFTIIVAAVLGTIGINSLLSSAAGAVKTTATVGMNLPGAFPSSNDEGALSQLPSSFQPIVASLKQGLKKANSEYKVKSSSLNDDNESSRGNDSIQANDNPSKESNNSIKDKERLLSKTDGSSSSHNNSAKEISSNEEKSSSSQDDGSDTSGEDKSIQVNNGSSEDSNGFAENTDGSSSANNSNTQEESSNQKDSSSIQNDDNETSRVNAPLQVNNDSSERLNNSNSNSSKNSDNPQKVNSNKNEQRYRHGHQHHAEDRIDSQALSLIATALIQGDVKQAKELIASTTELDEKQVDKLINSVKDKAEKLGNEIEKKANEARKYASAVLWLIFISYIIALIASVYGARLGMKGYNTSILQHTK